MAQDADLRLLVSVASAAGKFDLAPDRVLLLDADWFSLRANDGHSAGGPQVMDGYWQRPEETAQVIDSEGWLHTGDIAKMDAAGYFYIVDRKKDMILVSGFNVYPNEIEDVIATMPQVLEVAAVGVPDEKSGEAVKVVIVKKDQSLTAEQVKAFCKENLTGYKLPRLVEFRTELPKTNVGKILRRELRDAPKT